MQFSERSFIGQVVSDSQAEMIAHGTRRNYGNDVVRHIHESICKNMIAQFLLYELFKICSDLLS